ncbi:unnamed protein product [Peronospora belbahrii]|nr:unnamed protein product [Peronospora belbahrii]
MSSTATVPSLFSTGSGKTVTVSKSRLREYEEKLCSEEESVPGSNGISTTMSSTATVPSLFSTGSGKTVTVSKSRLREYEEKLCSKEESVPGSNGINTTMSSTATVPSLFSTGSGKTVTVSKSRLREYEEKLCSEEESVPGSSGISTTMSSTATVPSLFSTGSGKTVTVSKSRLREYEEKLCSKEESVPGSNGINTTMSSTATVPSLFSTGSGKTVTVSKSRLREYEEKLCSEEESVPGSSGISTTMSSMATVPSLFSTGSGKTVTVSKSRLREYEEKLCSEEESVPGSSGISTTMSSTATVPSLFSTGSGKTVTVSKSRLREYEEKLCSEEESVPGSSGISTTMSSTATVPSLFSTGSGKTVTVSKSRLREYEEKLCSKEESVPGSNGISTTMSSMATVPSLFRTMSDKLFFEEKVLWASRNAVIAGAIEARWDISGSGVTRNGDDEVRVGKPCEIGLSMKIRADVLGSPRDILMHRVTDANDLGQVSRCRGRIVSSDWSRENVRQIEPHGSLGRGLNFCGDKENVHPESVLDRETAALEASKARESTLTSKQSSLRFVRKHREHQYNRHQAVMKRALKPSIEPHAKMISERRRFYPPLPSKRLCANDSGGLQDSVHPAPPGSKRRKAVAVGPEPFVYREIMKVSLTSLMRPYEDHSLVEKISERHRREVLNCVTAENAVNVCFARDGGLMCFFEVSYDKSLFMGPRELYRQLRVEKQILKTMGATFTWFLNHYRWIVWKLAATERFFPRILLKKYLTKDQVLKQITCRHQRELNDAQRPILKQILSRDASSRSCMVLCIAAVLPFPAETTNLVDQELPACWNMALVLTDGWHSVYAVPDAPLATALWKLDVASSIVGTKLATWNASLQNSSEGIDPLECAIVRELQWKNPLLAKEDLTEWPYLQLRYNSTRRVKFDTRLGVEKLRYVIPSNSRHRKQQPQLTFALLKSIPLKSLEVGGGMVRSVRVRVVRISPVLHLQAKEWTLGPRILCSEQLPLYFELRSEYGKAAAQKRRQQEDLDSIGDDWSGDDQINIPLPVPFIKVDVECTHASVNGYVGSGSGILTIWRPSEELLSGGIKEGIEYFVSSLTINWKLDGGRNHDAFLQLSSTKLTRFEEVCDEVLQSGDEGKNAAQLTRGQRVCLDVQQATMNYRENFEEILNGRRNERRPAIDVCVYVVLVAAREAQDDFIPSVERQTEASLLDPGIKLKESRYVEHVFVTDQSCHLMCIRVSGMNVSMPTKTNQNSPLGCALSSSFDFRRGNKSIWKEGTVLCLSGLEISHYDEKLRVLDCVLVESTQIVTFPSKQSPYWNHFNLLQREAGIVATRSSSVRNFATVITQLKRYVERDILQVECVPFKACNELHVEAVEQERLTQDVQAYERDEDVTGQERDGKASSTLRQLTWEANVIKIMPLTGVSRLVFPSDVIAFACVSIETDDDTFRMVYLTREVMLSMQTLLKEVEYRHQEDAANGTDFALAQTITELLGKTTMCNTDFVFRFEVRQFTNERLINSWKPWERLHASYWIAETITSTRIRLLR